MINPADPWNRHILAAIGKSAQQIADETGLTQSAVKHRRDRLRAAGFDVPTAAVVRGSKRKPARIDTIVFMLARGDRQTDIAKTLKISDAAVAQVRRRHGIGRSANHDRKTKPVIRVPAGGFSMSVMQGPPPNAHLGRQTRAVL